MSQKFIQNITRRLHNNNIKIKQKLKDATAIIENTKGKTGIKASTQRKLDSYESNSELEFETIELQRIIQSAESYFTDKARRQLIYDGTISILDEIPMLDKVPILLSSSRSIILDVLNAIEFDIPAIKLKYGIDDFNFIKPILEPPKYIEGWYACSNERQRPVGLYRYVANFDVGDFMTRYKKIFVSQAETEFEHEIAGVYNLLELKTNQTRASTIDKLTLVLIESYYQSGYRTLSDLPIISLETSLIFYVLYLCLQPYDDLPFFDRSFNMQWTNVKVSASLPTIWYCLMNLGLQEVFGNISNYELGIAVKIYFSWAATSLDQEHLAQKGNYTDLYKLLHEKISKPSLLQTSKRGEPINIIQLNDSNEIWDGDEKDRLLQKLKLTHPSFQSWFNDFLNNVTTIEDVNSYIRIRVAISIMTNPGNFKKTAAVLDMDKSIKPVINAIIPFPKPKMTIPGIGVVLFDWNTTIPRLAKTYRVLQSFLPDLTKYFKRTNVEREFFNKLTNNSAGAKLTKLELENVPEIISKISNQRLIQTLLITADLRNKIKFMERLSEYGQMGVREQNNRRLRIIEVLSNVLQVLMIFGLIFGNGLTKIVDEIASGKQVGDIRDMAMQIHASGDPKSILSSFDIAGMDASTQEAIMRVIFDLVVEAVLSESVQTYFFQSSQKVDDILYSYDHLDSSQRSEIRRENVLYNALVLAIVEIYSKMRRLDFYCHDGFFYKSVIVNGLIFWSGAFHTASQHNVILTGLLRSIEYDWNSHVRQNRVVTTRTISGDDIFAVKIGRDDAVLGHAQFEQIELEKMGFKGSPELSRFYGIFLQQGAAFGVVVPQPMRLSLFTAERGDGRQRDIFENMMESYDILTEQATRSICPEQVIVIIRALWNVLRVITYQRTYESLNNNNIKQLMKHKYYRANSLGSKVLITHRKIMITIPFITICLSDWISAPIPRIRFSDTEEILPTSHLQPRGDIFNIILRPHILKREIGNSQYYMKIIQREAKKLITSYREVFGTFPPIINMKEIWVRQKDLLNYDRIGKLELNLASFLLKMDRQKLLARKRLPAADLPHIKDLADKLKTVQSQKLVNASLRAHGTLRLLNIEIPDSIVYGHSARTRVEQAVLKPSENLRERVYIDSDTVGILLAYDGSYILPKNEGMYDVTWELGDIITPSNDYHLNNVMHIIPGATPLSENALILRHTELVNHFSSTMGRTLSHLESEMWKGLQIDKLVDIGTSIMRRSPGALELYYEAVGVPHDLRSALTDLIRDAFANGLVDYRSIIQPRRYFMLSTYLVSYFKNGMYRVDGISNGVIQQFCDVLLRDLTLSYGHIVNKKFIIQIGKETVHKIKYQHL